MIFSAANNFNFSSEVVDPFTKYPFEIKKTAKGFPNQPQPKILTFCI